MEKQEDLQENKNDHQQLRRLVGILILVFIALVTYAVGKVIMAWVEDPVLFREKIGSYGAFGQVIFVLLVLLQVILAVIPGGPFELAGGYAFGAVRGTLLSILGCSLGSMSVFLLVRKYGHAFIRLFVSDKSLESVRFIAESKKVKILMAICFIIPGTPKDVLSYVAGLTDLSLFEWFMICTVGRLPGIFLTALAGHAAGETNYQAAVIALLVMGGISLLGLLAYGMIKNRVSQKAENKPEGSSGEK